MGYQRMKLDISKLQQKKALKGQKIRISQDMIGKGQLVFLHPVNYKKIINAKNGVMIELSPGEIMKSASYHNLVTLPTNLSGSGFFDSVWEGIKSAGKWLKDSGVGTAIADALEPVAASVIGPTGARLARNVVKGVAGVGIKKKTPKGSGLYL